MSEEKICPFISTVVVVDSKTNAIMVACKEEKCRAWGEIKKSDEYGDLPSVIGCRLIL